MALISINPVIPEREWKCYVDSHPKGKFCHLPVWKSIVEESLHHRPYYLFALDGSKICGILPQFLIKSSFNGPHLVSFPFFPSGGPIADSPEILLQLVQAATNLSDRLGCRYLELRMDEEAGVGLDPMDYYSTFVVDIDRLELVWKRLHQKSVRWAIKKAQKNGVTVKKSSDSKALLYFHSINFLTAKRIGLPTHPLLFFSSIFARAPANVDLYIGELNGLPIAGIICFKYKDTIEYAYGASDLRYLSYQANHLLVWHAMQDGYRAGYRHFDFGRTAPENEGLCRYKKHWGGVRIQIHNYYYPGIPNMVSFNKNGIKHKLVTGIWRNLPPVAARALNRFVCTQLD